MEVAGDISGAVVGGQGVTFALDAELAVGDAVAETAAGGSQVVSGIVQPAFKGIVPNCKLVIIKGDTGEMRPQLAYLSLQAAGASEGEDVNGLAVDFTMNVGRGRKHT